jgi:sugar O-acyltransferase (sialic acid O-acetyltransferase NeuD family)
MTQSIDLFIVGAGGHAREVAQLVDAINRVQPTYTLCGFVERDSSAIGRRSRGHVVVASDSDFLGRHAAAAMGLGFPQAIRRVAALAAEARGLQWPNLVHPSAIWQPEMVTFGKGNVVCAGVILTTDVRLGSFTLINRSANISHDVEIGDWSVVNPGAQLSGDVRIGRGCLIGAGAIVLQGRRVDDGAVVGAGAVVTSDVPAGVTVVSVPAAPHPAATVSADVFRTAVGCVYNLFPLGMKVGST